MSDRPTDSNLIPAKKAAPKKKATAKTKPVPKARPKPPSLPPVEATKREPLKLNRDLPYSQIVGMPGVKFLQDGVYFSNKGDEVRPAPREHTGLSTEELQHNIAKLEQKQREKEAREKAEAEAAKQADTVDKENRAAAAAEELADVDPS